MKLQLLYFPLENMKIFDSWCYKRQHETDHVAGAGLCTYDQ